MDNYLTAKDVAGLLKLSVHTIRRYTMLNKIPYHKNNRAVRYKKAEVELWFEKRKAAKVTTHSENQQAGLFTETVAGGETV